MIRWSKKVSQALIAELYFKDSQGIYDNELADEVGYALLARCESIVSVTYGFEHKKLICPRCGKDIPLKEDMFACICGFFATWDEFRKSYKNKQLYGANALPVFLAYRQNFSAAKSYGEKMIAIDTLIHSFHILHSYRKKYEIFDPENENITLGRPTGANLIEGSLFEVTAFLDDLTESKEKCRWQSIVKRANGSKNI